MAKRKAPYDLWEAKHIIHSSVDKIRALNPWHDPAHAHLWATLANLMEGFATVIRQEVPNCPEGASKLMEDEECSTSVPEERHAAP